MLFDDKSILALILSFLAGMSTLIGAFIVFLTKKRSEKLVSISLGFAGGVMISVSFLDLIPNAEEILIKEFGEQMGIISLCTFILLGVVIAAFLDRFVPHVSEHNSEKYTHQNLFRVGFISTLAIGLHNFPEGIATFMAGYDNLTLGVSIAIAIAMHNIPEGISVAMPIYFSTGSIAKAFKYTFLSGIAEPIGALSAFLILRPFINPLTLGLIFSLISGIMLYIAFEELIPTSRQYGYTRTSIISIFVGIILMPLSHII